MKRFINKKRLKLYMKKRDMMKIQYIFYTVGVIFIIATVIYFTKEFIVNLPDPIKLVLLIISVVVSFIVAEFLREADK